MINSIASHILALPAALVLLLAFALPALESSAFVGFVFPGEVALILGGVLVAEGRVPIAGLLACGVAGAIAGDSVGYAVGRRWGRRLLDGTLGRFVHHNHLDRGERYLAERGAKAVFLGRFTAALRVMIPGLAGMARMRYRTFLFYNIAGGAGWATMSVLLGYLGGNSWRHLQHVASGIGLAMLCVLVLGATAGHLVRRRRRAADHRPAVSVHETIAAPEPGTAPRRPSARGRRRG
jgi:membrane protein DedA with SNARE-associated domain